MTNLRLEHKTLIPNYALRQVIEGMWKRWTAEEEEKRKRLAAEEEAAKVEAE